MRKALSVLVVLVLAACSSDEPPPEDHVFRTQTDALKKAQEVEKKTLEQADRMRQQLDAIDTSGQDKE
ncbi:MAG: hypothetical protein OEY67_01835 [Gammaproteobacteria bacterium]|nr:hypothetical protein [Gammaproteobacteria bacterium]